MEKDERELITNIRNAIIRLNCFSSNESIIQMLVGYEGKIYTYKRSTSPEFILFFLGENSLQDIMVDNKWISHKDITTRVKKFQRELIARKI